MRKMKSIKELKDLRGKTAVVRVDFNVPLRSDGQVADDFRIQRVLPTIDYLQTIGARIILITHLGKGGQSLAPVASVLNKYLKASFVKDIVGRDAETAVKNLHEGGVLLLENLRNNEGEQKADPEFARKLASYGDIYVNEAFPVSHRPDASVVLIPTFLPSYAGLQFEEEVKHLSHAFDRPKHPFLFILGGAKFSTKMPLIEKYLNLADNIFIGGALLNDFLKARGYEVGKSLVSEESFGIEKIMNNPKLILATDVLVTSGGKSMLRKINEIGKDESILDIGKDSIQNLADVIKKAQLILWNGPVGKYEEGGAEGSKEILKAVAASKAESIVGGGDTIALISEMKMDDNFYFVSTGGGATLDYLANGTLPGIKALG